jgi:hypothetical protein
MIQTKENFFVYFLDIFHYIPTKIKNEISCKKNNIVNCAQATRAKRRELNYLQ